LYIGTPSTTTSAACSSAISASSSATRAFCAGVRCSAGVNRACSVASSSAGCGVRPEVAQRQRGAGVGGLQALGESFAMRVECEPTVRALELICRMFMVASLG
jgi:hypothetical protein